MKRSVHASILLLGLLALASLDARGNEDPSRSGWAAAANEPRYASPATRRAVLAMIEAHGDLERWRSARTVSFTRRLVFAPRAEGHQLTATHTDEQVVVLVVERLHPGALAG